MSSKYALANANVITSTETPIKFWAPDMTIDTVIINVPIDLATILENQNNRVEVVTVLTSFDN
jgi:hypothetical protein